MGWHPLYILLHSHREQCLIKPRIIVSSVGIRCQMNGGNTRLELLWTDSWKQLGTSLRPRGSSDAKISTNSHGSGETGYSGREEMGNQICRCVLESIRSSLSMLQDS